MSSKMSPANPPPRKDGVHLGRHPESIYRTYNYYFLCIFIHSLQAFVYGTTFLESVYNCVGLECDPGPGSDPFRTRKECMLYVFLPSISHSISMQLANN